MDHPDEPIPSIYNVDAHEIIVTTQLAPLTNQEESAALHTQAIQAHPEERGATTQSKKADICPTSNGAVPVNESDLGPALIMAEVGKVPVSPVMSSTAAGSHSGEVKMETVNIKQEEVIMKQEEVDGSFTSMHTAQIAASPESKPMVTENVIVKAQSDDLFRRIKAAISSTDSSHEDLEEYCKLTRIILQDLGEKLQLVQVHDNPDVQRLMKNIHDLLHQLSTSQTYIGVLGNTGSGKSSLLNALFGEKVLPTNGMRACTAVPTEVAYNSSDDPEERYIAHIEFISEADWLAELENLFQDLVDDNGKLSTDHSNKETEAGIAWAKIKSIYPHYTKETLCDADVSAESIIEESVTVRKLLGTTQTIKCASIDDFQKQVQSYVDSKDKKRSKPLTTGIREPLEWWPLIKSVRLLTKSDMIKSGAVFVDLPGCGDSNQARATVAGRYMEKCTRLWVVAPITRAVDDKVAEKLLGDAFRMQLKFDGMGGCVTFVCSKTDDIETQEIVQGLELEDELDAYKSQEAQREREFMQCHRRLDETEEQREMEKARFTALKRQLDLWKDLDHRQSRGETVYAPSAAAAQAAPVKRKSQISQRLPPSKHRKSHRSGRGTLGPDVEPQDAGLGDFDSEDEVDTGESITAGRVPLAPREAHEKLAKIKIEGKAARENYKTLSSTIEELEVEIAGLESLQVEEEEKFKAFVIKERNSYSRDTIKNHFARGIRDLDMECTDAENSADGRRDHQALGEAMQVFCTSSRAYLKLRGQIEDDGGLSGFLDEEDTEIPQLRKHAMNLARSPRMGACKGFLNKALTILQSTETWITTQVKAMTEVFVQPDQALTDDMTARIDMLETSLQRHASQMAEDCMNMLVKRLFGQNSIKAIDRAAKASHTVCDKWEVKKKDGGLAAGTYRAVMRRDGAYKKKAKGSVELNFNEDLSLELMKALGARWESAFKDITKTVAIFATACPQIIQMAHQDVVAIYQRKSPSSPIVTRLNLLKPQIASHGQNIRDTLKVYDSTIGTWRREASRKFMPSVRMEMKVAYDHCKAEHGLGCTARSQEHIRGHISDMGPWLFKPAVDVVKETLKLDCNQLSDDLFSRVSEIAESMRADYMLTTGRLEVAAIPTHVVADVTKLLRDVDTMLQNVTDHEMKREDGTESSGPAVGEIEPMVQG